jgi:hypothetical protein
VVAERSRDEQRDEDEVEGMIVPQKWNLPEALVHRRRPNIFGNQ